jgi:hypothetical protein
MREKFAMKKYIISAVAVIVLLAVAFVSGLRIVTFEPSGPIPDGLTALIIGPTALHLIDSPAAICMRREGQANLFCRFGVAGSIAGNSTVLLRFPYSKFLADIAL